MSDGIVRNRVFFVGGLNTASVQTFSYFKENWEVVSKINDASEVGEIHHEQKCIFIFSDVRKALEFLDQTQLKGKCFLGLISDREGRYKDTIMEIFEAHALHFYTPKNTVQLVDDVNQFLLGGLVTTEDIEFSVQLALEEN